jgi:hypothetical protein
MFFSSPVWASEYVELVGISKKSYKDFIYESLKPLEAKLKTYKKRIKILARPLSSINPNICNIATNEKQIYWGYAIPKKNTIVINNKLFPFIDKDREINCYHKSMQKQIKASIYHELSHILKTLDNRKGQNNLNTLGFFKKPNRKARQHKTSRRYPEIKRTLKNKNTGGLRSPDFYEYTNINEFYAVNFEYFMLDPEYKCRRPELYQLFEKDFGLSPTVDCETNKYIVLNDRKESKIKLDAANIKSIHYLLAGESESIASQFGHSMILFEYCKTPDCNKIEKFAMEFTGFTEGPGYSISKGLFGGYSLNLSFSSFDSVIMKYNYLEDRDFKTFALNLSPREKERFLNITLRYYWEFTGDYYFLSSNCATELLKIIQFTYDDKVFYKESIISPNGLRDLLLKHSYTSPQKIKFFPSLTERLRVCSRHFFSTDDYIRLPAQTRQTIIEKNFDEIGFNCFYALEQLAHVQENKKLNSLYNTKIVKSKNKELKQKLKMFYQLEKPILYGIKPIGSYGIPTHNDNSTEYQLAITKEKHKKLEESILELTGFANAWTDLENLYKSNLRSILNLYNKEKTEEP